MLGGFYLFIFFFYSLNFHVHQLLGNESISCYDYVLGSFSYMPSGLGATVSRIYMNHL